MGHWHRGNWHWIIGIGAGHCLWAIGIGDIGIGLLASGLGIFITKPMENL